MAAGRERKAKKKRKKKSLPCAIHNVFHNPHQLNSGLLRSGPVSQEKLVAVDIPAEGRDIGIGSGDMMSDAP